MLRSIGKPRGAYQPVETSDYEVLEHEGAEYDHNGQFPASASRDAPYIPHVSHQVPRSRQTSSSYPPPEPESPVRTASREGSILSHPTPGLQSLQGAYVGNIERLEQSAARLSLGSGIGEELKKLHFEQKRFDRRRASTKRTTASRQFSTSSHSNSILRVNSIARSGGFSPEAYVGSPAESMLSPPWSARSYHERVSQEQMEHRQEPAKEGRPLDSPISPRVNVLTVRNQDDIEGQNPQGDAHMQQTQEEGHNEENTEEPINRPASANSDDTFRRASHAFADFDGVHIPIGPNYQDQLQLDQFGPANLPQESQYQFPPQQDNMVYYPAPVPMVLNLPKKLSKAPQASQVAQRKSQMLMGLQNQRKSKGHFGETSQSQGDDGSDLNQRQSVLPPQLRATMFFEHQPVQRNVQVQSESAVATLDNILDAAAFAPVSAFTDHPIVGQAGADVYMKSKVDKQRHRKTQSSMHLDAPRSSGLDFLRGRGRDTMDLQATTYDDDEPEDVDDEGRPFRRSVDGVPYEDDLEDEEAESEEEEDDDNALHPMDEFPYMKPTTLLAELQMRKQKQQLRNRTAATAFPHGMHSTLLQLDAVAQIQRQARNQQHVTLAWEDTEEAHPGDDRGDEDTPLGLLFPGQKAGINDDDRPLGLLAQRAMEDNEPLSKRRARLRGEQPVSRVEQPVSLPPPPFEQKQSHFNLEVRGVTDTADDDKEEETLAQRKARLRGEQTIKARPISGEFVSELLSQFGNLEEPKPVETSKTPDPDETLGQRRKRLQAEKAAREAQESSRPSIEDQPKRHSMANILQAHPTGPRIVSQGASRGISSGGLVGNGLNWQGNHTQTIRQVPMTSGFVPGQIPGQAPYGGWTGNNYQGSYVNPMTFTPMTNLNGQTGVASGYSTMMPMAEPTMDPSQRARIDQWRQSVFN